MVNRMIVLVPPDKRHHRVQTAAGLLYRGGLHALLLGVGVMH